MTLRRALVCGGLAVAGVAIQILRLWPSVPLNSIWAEDGGVWLADAINRGFLDAVTTPYNGYLQTLSRLVAEPVAALPVEWFAAAMAICGAAIVTGCAFLVWHTSAAQIQTPYLRATLAAMVVLIPVAGAETLDNVTNSIWFLMFAGFWLLLWRPATFTRAVGAGALIFLGAVSNLEMLVLSPLWLLRLIAIRDRRDGVIIAGFAAGVAIQLGLSWNDRNILGETGATGLAHTYTVAETPFSSHWDWGLLPAYAQRVVPGAIINQRTVGYAWERLGTPFEVAMGVALVVFIALALVSRGSRVRVFVPLTVAISIALFLVAGTARGAGSLLLWPGGTWNNGLSHYLVVPTLLLLSALVVQLDARGSVVAPGAWHWLRTGIALFLLFGALVSFRVSDTRGPPVWSSALQAARSRCIRQEIKKVAVPVAPSLAGFSRFRIPLSCSELNGEQTASDRTPRTR
jgi:hypothetical protein